MAKNSHDSENRTRVRDNFLSDSYTMLNYLVHGSFISETKKERNQACQTRLCNRANAKVS